MREGDGTLPESTPAASAGGPTLLYAVKQVELAVRAHLDDVLRPHGVSTTQYTALTVLERRHGMTSAALARRSFVTAQTMGDVVIALEQRQLIVRHRDPDHGRRLTISLTARGQRLLEEVRRDVGAVEEQMTDGLSGEDRERLRSMLRLCLENLSAGHDAPKSRQPVKAAGS
jgi:DNA-binding MarR family transcriptional regulator